MNLHIHGRHVHPTQVKIARYLAYTRREVERAHASRYALTLKARAAWRTRHGRTHINASGPIPPYYGRGSAWVKQA